jgi:multicomponent Na+:H+ antiporter subunit D
MTLPFALETHILLAIAVPFIGAGLIPLFHRQPNLRETVTLATAAVLAVLVWTLLPAVLAGARPERTLVEVLPGLAIAFQVEPLGLLFGLVAGSLWIVNSIYSIGYMRGNDEPRQTSFYVCFAVALGSAIGLAFAKNLFTLFLFYELLTLSTYPLVTHKATDEAIRGGRIYLMLLIGSSMLLLLPAIMGTWFLAGTTDFKAGGILPASVAPAAVALLLALFMFGIGKAALMPLHFWLPAAMVAPTPVSALLHAVAVVKAGVFTVLKVIVYVFGLERLTQTGASEWLVYAASFTLVLASVVALTRGNLKARLAYSTVSQLAYVVLAGALASSMSVAGGALHIAMHAAGKITLFFCAGAIYVAHHVTEIRDLDGIGRKMPLTMLAFLIGSLSIIGLPPLGGAWSKWAIGLGAYDAGYSFVIGVLMVSSLLNVAYLMPIVARAFFVPSREPDSGPCAIEEAPVACLVALGITASLCVVLFFIPGRIEALVAPVLGLR